MLPFTHQQFLAVFSNYNKAIWPSQILAYPLGSFAALLLFRQRNDRIVSSPLCSLLHPIGAPVSALVLGTFAMPVAFSS